MKRILLILFMCFILIGCNNTTLIDTGVVLSSNLEMVLTKKDNCSNYINEYYKRDGRKVYLICLDEINLKANDEYVMSLKDFFTNVNQSFENSINEITANLKVDDILKDGGTIIYRNENLTVIKCNTLEGNKDIYIGDGSLKHRNSYCK